MPIPPVQIGEVVAGKYTVEAVIGEGGMGVVVAARHVDLDQRVAIKFLLPEIANQGTAAERFRREARSAARIKGEHVCRVLDVGTLGTGVPYLVMEHLEGCDLALELERRGRLPVAEAVEYVLQACEGLAEAHAASIVHRDLKPANLFLAARADGSRRVKILDFGVSKSLSDSGEGNHALTQTSSLVGSPLYMSPEQLSSSKSVDPRSDIWALGAVLFELIAGKPPFNGENIPQLVHAVMNNKPASLEAMDASLPRGIDAVIGRALQKQRDERFASVAELANELAPYAPRHALLSVSRVSRLLASSERRASQGLAATESADEQPQRASNEHGTPMSWSAQKRETRKRIGVGVVLALLGVAAALVYALRARDPQLAAPPPGAGEPHVAKPAPVRSKTAATSAAPVPDEEAPAPAPSAAVEQPSVLDPVPELLPSGGASPSLAAPQPVELERPEHERRAPRRERAPETSAAPAPAVAPTPSPAPAPVAPREQPDKPGLSDFGGRR